MMEATIGHNSQPVRNNDWIAVYRGLRTHPIIGFLNPDGTRRKAAKVCQSMAWIDLCMEANWRDRHENSNGKMALVERGQLQGGRSWLAQRWGWTENQVRWFLKKLQDEGMIIVERPKITPESHTNHTLKTTKQTAKSTRFPNIITVCNYNTYQTVSELSELLDNQINHQTNNQITTKQPPHSNKETNKQDTILDARARVDLDGLEAKLLEAANGAMANPAVAPGVLVLTEPIRWLSSGCDLEMDILPTIRARAHRLRRGSVKSWSYFTDAIADAKSARLAPIPEGRGSPPGQSPHWRDEDRLQSQKLQQALEKAREKYIGQPA